MSNLLLKRYRLLEKLEEDEIFVYSKGQDTNYGNRLVLIAQLKNHWVKDPSFAEELYKLFEKMLEVRSSEICKVLSLHYDQKIQCLVVTCNIPPGKPLPKIPPESRALGKEKICHMVCEALHQAHKRGIFHGYLRPKDIWIHEEKLTLRGFGYLPAVTRGWRGDLQEVSPELKNGKSHDGRVDVFAVARLLRELYPSLSNAEPILKALQENPEKRQKRIRDFEKELYEYWKTLNDNSDTSELEPINESNHPQTEPPSESTGLFPVGPVKTRDPHTLEVFKEPHKRILPRHLKVFLLILLLTIPLILVPGPTQKYFSPFESIWNFIKQQSTQNPTLPSQIVTSKDGASMVLISKGEFIMGSQSGLYPDEEPKHRVYLTPFYMDIKEVSVLQYSKFLNETANALPQFWDLISVFTKNKPVVGISWKDAVSYCRWAEKRLPTEAEWEKAARGIAGQPFPWGVESPNANLANFGPRETTDTNPYTHALEDVGSYEEGKSPYGIFNMAGNGSEWVEDWYDKNYYGNSPHQNPRGPDNGKGKYRVIRGGSWRYGSVLLRTTTRNWSLPTKRYPDVGMRCVKDIE